MAEVKNAFIKSKMNKDLDDRLIPSGEYREGFNIQVSKSESQDVGALENVLGNSLEVNFSTLAGLSDGALSAIGVYAHTTTNTVFVFLTDYTESSGTNYTYSSSANNFIYSYNTYTRTATKLVQGAFLNFSTKSPIYGINLMENLLFWTDNRNQPRKINIELANGGSFYTTEDQISVAKYNPYRCIDLYTYKSPVYTPPLPSTPYWQTTMVDATSKNLPDNSDNPDYDETYPGDPDYLEDKFVRFSYRFKFVDGEMSILAPFTQVAYIPKQDGYFLDKSNPALGNGNSSDENEAYRSTVVNFMENKVNRVELQIPLPTAGNQLYDTYHVTEIEILYKESDGLAVKVLDTITRDQFEYQADESTPQTEPLYQYDYQSRKPIKTLPEAELIRVYDKVPVRAFGQEVIGNRIVYSNFQNKHTPPEFMDYEVGVTPKSNFYGPPVPSGGGNTINEAEWKTSIIEYPEHTLKQNRNYQVGFVLSDRFGRSSTTILSSIKSSTVTANNIPFAGSTFYHPYYTAATMAGTGVYPSVNNWPGDSIKILLNAAISDSPANLQSGWPGLYNGDPTSSSYNPLGWYSYKVVVKQTEQDYYNVYLPGIIDGYPNDPNDPPTIEVGQTAFITLLNDNINKVPRDLSEVGPEQKTFRSSVNLYGRVTPNNAAPPTHNIPFYPTVKGVPVADFVSTIGDQDTVFNLTPPATINDVYQSETNPLQARLTQGQYPDVAIGSIPDTTTTNYPFFLGVYETSPTTSAIDIFWETSTSGLISDLNQAIGTTAIPVGFAQFNFSQTEATLIGTTVTGDFYPLADTGLGTAPLADTEINIWNAKDGAGNDRTSDWTLVTNTGGQFVTYNLKTTKILYYGPNASVNQSFTFTFHVVDKTDPSNPVTNIMSIPNVNLGNVAPTITHPASSPATITVDAGTTTIDTLTAVNGCADTSKENLDLTWSIVTQNPANTFSISSDGVLTQPSGNLSGNASVTVKVEDAGGLSDQVIYGSTAVDVPGVIAGKDTINPDFGETSNTTINKSGIASVGFFWSSNYNNCVRTTPNPTFLGSSYSSGDSRVAYPSLTLPLNIGTGGYEDKVVTGNPPFNDGATQCYGAFGINDTPSWYNSNYNAKAFGASSNPSGLTSGTAFIKVDFQWKAWPWALFNSTTPNSNFPFPANYDSNYINPYVAWQAFLQYRDPNGANYPNNWQTAIDVEGNPIKFGSSIVSDYTINNATAWQGISTTNGDFGKTGVLNVSNAGYSAFQAQLGNPSDITSIKIRQPNLNDNPNPQTAPALGGESSIIGVFGKDQGYNNASYFGDYRLIIRYPASLSNFGKVIPSTTNCGDKMFLGNPGSIAYLNQNVTVKLSFGDFYYPAAGLYKGAFLHGNRVETDVSSYGYLVSTTGNASQSTAAGLTPSKQVYAREWAMKYVTQFYENPELTTKWNGGSGNYHSYSPSGAGELCAIAGTQNASSISGSYSNSVKNQSNQKRRWTAKFNSSGLKTQGTAKPNTITGT